MTSFLYRAKKIRHRYCCWVGACCIKTRKKMVTFVVYFDQRLVAAHSKCWLKYTFSLFFVQKN